MILFLLKIKLKKKFLQTAGQSRWFQDVNKRKHELMMTGAESDRSQGGFAGKNNNTWFTVSDDELATGYNFKKKRILQSQKGNRSYKTPWYVTLCADLD